MDVGALASALAAIAPPDVITGVRLIDEADIARAHPAEMAHVANAVDRRRHEFATGRALLRTLLGTDEPIAVGPTRAPVFPEGWVGSLAHDRRVALAAVAPAATVWALGVDVEPVGPLSPEVADLVLRVDESGIDAHLAFTLKEAAYKAWSGLGGRMLDHHDVRLQIDGGRFSAEIVAERTAINGWFVTNSGRHVALSLVRGPVVD